MESGRQHCLCCNNNNPMYEALIQLERANWKRLSFISLRRLMLKGFCFESCKWSQRDLFIEIKKYRISCDINILLNNCRERIIIIIIEESRSLHALCCAKKNPDDSPMDPKNVLEFCFWGSNTIKPFKFLTLKIAFNLCFLFLPNTSQWFSDRLSGTMPNGWMGVGWGGGAFLFPLIPDNVFPDHFYLLPPSGHHLLQSGHFTDMTPYVLDDTRNGSSSVDQIVFDPTPPPPTPALCRIESGPWRTPVNLTLKHIWNLLLTMYNAMGLMHELSAAMLMPK